MLNRRQFLGALIGALGVGAVKPNATRATSEQEVYCSWVLQASECADGRIVEHWCYMCCDGISCDTYWCEERDGGPC